jgi:hypothetical protein
MAVEVKTMEMKQFAEILKGDERKVCMFFQCSGKEIYAFYSLSSADFVNLSHCFLHALTLNVFFTFSHQQPISRTCY